MTAPRFGDYVRIRRKRIGKSLRQLAGECGISAPNLVAIEKGRRNATHEQAGRLAAVLGESDKAEEYQVMSLLDRDVIRISDLSGVDHHAIATNVTRTINARVGK